MTAAPSRTPLGDGGLLLRWQGSPGPAQARLIAVAWKRLRAKPPAVIEDLVPGPASLLVRFDPRRTTFEDVERWVVEADLDADDGSAAAARHQVPVRYGGPEGPDLNAAARRLGISPDQLVRLHSRRDYTVLATGFAPGFVYLGPLPPSLRLDRRPEPRRSVPAGSVAIAGPQTGIYGAATAGGWWLIGRTAVDTFNVGRRPPVRFDLGDSLRFVPE